MSAPSCCLISHNLQEGVGPADANRLLAGELAQRGCRVSLCGLNDSALATVRAEEMDLRGRRLPALQIPQALSWEERGSALGNFLKEQEPDFVIIRFIPYSLNPKGIVWQASRFLPPVLRGRAVIWLVDEIWLGTGAATLKHRLIGALQRYSILRLLKGVASRRVYANNRFNTGILRGHGLNAGTLRLFGNVPVAAPEAGEWLFGEFAKVGIPITPANRQQWLVLGNFGVFHSDWDPAAFFSNLRDRARQHGKQVCLAGIGGLGAYRDHWRKVAESWSNEFKFIHLGRRTEIEVSYFLQSVDFGLTTNPGFLVGKSGTCMAMLDHGLPIIVPRITDDDDPTEFPAHLVLRCGDHVREEIFAPREARAPDPELARAAGILMAAMSERR